jgi:hypothetical protein
LKWKGIQQITAAVKKVGSMTTAFTMIVKGCFCQEKLAGGLGLNGLEPRGNFAGLVFSMKRQQKQGRLHPYFARKALPLVSLSSWPVLLSASTGKIQAKDSGYRWQKNNCSPLLT